MTTTPQFTDLYIIRHGQTAWNRDKIFRGRKDIPLDEQGRREALLTAKWLRGTRFDAIYSSPLLRAYETAVEIARGRNISVEKHPGLIDISFGRWEGMKEKEVIEKYPDIFEKWHSRPHETLFPMGEDLRCVQERALKAVFDISEKHRGKTVALVSHRVVLKVIILGLLGMRLDRFWFIQQDTCCINRFRISDGDAIVLLLNDTCHMREIERQMAGTDF